MAFDFMTAKQSILQDVAALASTTLKDFVTQAREDTEDFLNDTRGDLEGWGKALAEGKLSRRDFEFLLKMRMDLAEMHALTAAGLAQQAVERFRKSVISIIVRAFMAAI